MKTKDIAMKYELNPRQFDVWIEKSPYRFKTSLLGALDLDDGQDIDIIISSFKEWVEAERQRLEQAEKDQSRATEEQNRAAIEKQSAVASILITSGFNFDGYTVTRYSGYISGDDVVQIARGTQGFFGGGVTDVGTALMESLVVLRRNAMNELKEAALALGCNAVIGVDFDYLNLDPVTVNNQGGTLYLPYIFGVTANGNAVVIERNA